MPIDFAAGIVCEAESATVVGSANEAVAHKIIANTSKDLKFFFCMEVNIEKAPPSQPRLKTNCESAYFFFLDLTFLFCFLEDFLLAFFAAFLFLAGFATTSSSSSSLSSTAAGSSSACGAGSL